MKRCMTQDTYFPRLCTTLAEVLNILTRLRMMSQKDQHLLEEGLTKLREHIPFDDGLIDGLLSRGALSNQQAKTLKVCAQYQCVICSKL